MNPKDRHFHRLSPPAHGISTLATKAFPTLKAGISCMYLSSSQSNNQFNFQLLLLLHRHFQLSKLVFPHRCCRAAAVAARQLDPMSSVHSSITFSFSKVFKWPFSIWGIANLYWGYIWLKNAQPSTCPQKSTIWFSENERWRFKGCLELFRKIIQFGSHSLPMLGFPESGVCNPDVMASSPTICLCKTFDKQHLFLQNGSTYIMGVLHVEISQQDESC